jgi:DNA-binding protein YbaB
MDDGMSPMGEAAQVAAQLREQSARLSAAAAASAAVSYEAKAAAGGHGEMAVTADGRGEVTRIRIGAGAIRSGAGVLEATLPRLVNEAVCGAQARATQAMLDAVEPGLRASVAEGASATSDAAEQLAARIAGETVGATSPDGKVTVSASGAGEIQTVRFAAGALAAADNVTLGEQVAAAVGAALGEARRRQQRQLDALHDDEETMTAVLDARLAVFDRRMEELRGQLEQADRRISDLE